MKNEQPKEKQKESKDQNEPKEYRDRKYNEQIEVVKCEIEVKSSGERETVRVILTDTEQKQFTYKLKRETKTTIFNEELGMSQTNKSSELVKEKDMGKHVPQVFREISAYLKNNASIVLNVSYSISGLTFDNPKGMTLYYYFMKGDTETIYSEKIHKSDERLKLLIKKTDEALSRKEGKKTDL